jgi:hypothetical protein
MKLMENLTGIDFNGNGYDIYIRVYYVRGPAPCNFYSSGYQDLLPRGPGGLQRIPLVAGGAGPKEVGEYAMEFTHTIQPMSCYDFSRGYVVRVQSAGQVEYYIARGRRVFNGTFTGFQDAIKYPIPFFIEQ